MFSKEELIQIGQLILSANIKGGDSIVVAKLLQKIDRLAKEEQPKIEPNMGG